MNLQPLLNDESNVRFSEWANIQLKIGELSPEYLNVGVLFRNVDGNIQSRFVQDFSGLECLLGADFNEDLIKEMLNITSTALQTRSATLSDIILPTPSLRITQPSSIQADLMDDPIGLLWDETITLDNCCDIAPKEEKFKHINNADVRKIVFDILKNKMGVDADWVLNQEKSLQLETESNRTIQLDVPLVTGSAVGSVVSGWYANWSSVERNLTHGVMDINAASHYSKKPGQAIFLQRPENTSKISPKELNQIDEKLDVMSHKLKASGVNFFMEHEPELLAEDIERWAHDTQ